MNYYCKTPLKKIPECATDMHIILIRNVIINYLLKRVIKISRSICTGIAMIF